MDENKRYLSKYADLRAFAYSQIESLVRKQANIAQKKGRYGGGPMSSNAVSQNSLAVYKQMIEKERKQWQEERNRKDAFIAEI